MGASSVVAILVRHPGLDHETMQFNAALCASALGIVIEQPFFGAQRFALCLNQVGNSVLFEIRWTAKICLDAFGPIQFIDWACIHSNAAVPGGRLAEDIGMPEQQCHGAPPGLAESDEQAAFPGLQGRESAVNVRQYGLQDVAFILSAHVVTVISIPGLGREFRCHTNQLIGIVKIVLRDLQQTVSVPAFITCHNRKHIEDSVRFISVVILGQENAYVCRLILKGRFDAMRPDAGALSFL